MNAAEWRAVAHPIVADTVAVVEEYLPGATLAHFGPALVGRYRAAGRCHDAEALLAVCTAIKKEAHALMLATERQDGRKAA